jgi:SAM-dependent methyltransferase
MNAPADTLAVYERWAPHYPPVPHNPLMRAEQRAMMRYWPQVSHCGVLDLACGTGRYAQLLADSRAANVVAVDFCMPMLMQVSGAARVCADMMHLPFAADGFDVVISGLALAHATDIYRWMAEVSRVLRRGGTLLYSDFHPEAARAGLKRSFKDKDERTFQVMHTEYPVPTQLAAAKAAGLCVDIVHEIRVGDELCEPFENSGEFYRRWHGVPIVVIVRAYK